MWGGRFITALIALAVLFAASTRVPGGMLTFRSGVLSYQICTGQGVQQITVPSESPAPDIGCDFFAAQVVALLGTEPALQAADVQTLLTWHLQNSSLEAITGAKAYLIRGPPALS